MLIFEVKFIIHKSMFPAWRQAGLFIIQTILRILKDYIMDNKNLSTVSVHDR